MCRLFLVGVSWYRGTCYRGPNGTARLAKTEELAEVHAKLGMASRGHEMFPGVLEEPQPLEGGPMGAGTCRRRRVFCGREGAKVMQYNCESLRAVGRLGELARMAVKEGVDIICFQGTQMDIEGEWSDELFMYIPLPRTRGAKDGCMIAVSTRFRREQVVCVHHWMEGRIIGLRVKAGRGATELDAYVMSAYAPVQDPHEPDPDGRIERRRNAFWDKLDGAVRQVPRRSTIVMCIDANGEVEVALPWVGRADEKRNDRAKKWTDNGRRFFEVAKGNDMKVVSTFGKANAQCWTWLSPVGKKHRIDYIAVRGGSLRTSCRGSTTGCRSVWLASGTTGR